MANVSEVITSDGKVMCIPVIFILYTWSDLKHELNVLLFEVKLQMSQVTG